MNQTAPAIRPPLTEALAVWEKMLAERGMTTDILWLFEENLCVEESKLDEGGYRFGFQTKFTPPPDDALDIAFDHFAETEARLVFYRLGDTPDKSVCILLCDSWFNEKKESDGFIPRDEWNLSFHPGHQDGIEEITDLTRWLRRIKRGRAFRDLDFCMALATVEEIRIYGRPLVPYERFADSMRNRLRRILGKT